MGGHSEESLKKFSATQSPNGSWVDDANGEGESSWRDPEDYDEFGKNGFKWSEMRKFLGPAWLVSIAYLDPGNLETDLQAGAQFGYDLVWVLLWSSILGIIVQIMSLRLGIVSRRNLAQMCRDEYHPRLRMLLWIFSEIMIVASDVPEVVGTAFALQILSKNSISLMTGVLIASCSTLIFLVLTYFGKSWLEGFVASLVAIISVCFVFECIEGQPAAWQTLEGLAIPKVPTGSENIAVGLLGAVVMPHNLFLQSALVQNRQVCRNKRSLEYSCFYSSLETTVALLTSFFVNTSVLLVAAASFAPNFCIPLGEVCHGGKDNCDGEPPGKCMAVGLQTASELLEKILGTRASVLWGVALLASGQSSTITGTYAGQFVMEGFIQMTFPLWIRNLISRSLAVIPSLLVVIIGGAEGANNLVVLSSVVLAMHLPFALVPLLKFTDSAKKLGQLRNSAGFSGIAWMLGFCVVCANASLVVQNVILPLLSDVTQSYWGLKLCVVILSCLCYFGLLGYLTWLPVRINVSLPPDVRLSYTADEVQRDLVTPLIR